jgi:hypothetical protein
LITLIALAAALIDPPSLDEAKWVHFHTWSDTVDRLDYFYDSSSVRVSDGKVTALVDVMGRSPPTLIVYRTSIDCRKATFSELGTTTIDAKGRSTKTPKSELWINHPIRTDSSSDKLMKHFCPKA